MFTSTVSLLSGTGLGLGSAAAGLGTPLNSDAVRRGEADKAPPICCLKVLSQ